MLRRFLLLLLLSSGPAAAGPLTFEAAGFDYTGTPSYAQDGFLVENVGGVAFGPSWDPAGQAQGPITITSTGGAFTFGGLDAGTWSSPSTGVSVTSVLSGGGVGPSTSLTVAFGGLTTFDLSAVFAATLLQEVVIGFAGVPYLSYLDNVVVASGGLSAVPLPLGLPLLLSALGGLALIRWRMQHAIG